LVKVAVEPDGGLPAWIVRSSMCSLRPRNAMRGRIKPMRSR
jgi:hypothetical protein